MYLLEYNASLMWNLIPYGSIILALPKPAIRFLVSDMVLTLPLVKVKIKKYLLSQRIVCVVALSARHTSPTSISIGFQSNDM